MKKRGLCYSDLVTLKKLWERSNSIQKKKLLSEDPQILNFSIGNEGSENGEKSSHNPNKNGGNQQKHA